MVDGVGGFGVGLSNSCRKCSTSASSHHHALAVIVKAQEFVPCRANLSADSGAASLSRCGPLEQMCVELPEDGRPSYHISDFSFALPSALSFTANQRSSSLRAAPRGKQGVRRPA